MYVLIVQPTRTTSINTNSSDNSWFTVLAPGGEVVVWWCGGVVVVWWCGGDVVVCR